MTELYGEVCIGKALEKWFFILFFFLGGGAFKAFLNPDLDSESEEESTTMHAVHNFKCS